MMRMRTPSSIYACAELRCQNHNFSCTIMYSMCLCSGLSLMLIAPSSALVSTSLASTSLPVDITVIKHITHIRQFMLNSAIKNFFA